MMFGGWCGLNVVKVLCPLPVDTSTCLQQVWCCGTRYIGYISGPLSHCVSPVVRELAGAGPKPNGRCGIWDKCPRARGR